VAILLIALKSLLPGEFLLQILILALHKSFVENYHHNEADFYTDLIKMGMPERVIFKHYQLFGDIWNYFPHKRLKGKSPVELFRDKHNNI